MRDEPNSAALHGGKADLELGSRRPPEAQTHTRLIALEPLRLALPDEHRLALPDEHRLALPDEHRLALPDEHRLALPDEHQLAGQRRVRLAEVAGEPFIGLQSASALRWLTDHLCEQAGFRPTVIFDGDDLSNVHGFVAAGLGVAVVSAPRIGSPEAVPGPVAYLEILDSGAVREIFLTWSAERRPLPATDLFRRHVLRRAATGRLPAVADP